MPSTRLAIATLGSWALIASTMALADTPPPTNAIRPPSEESEPIFSRKIKRDKAGTTSTGGTAGWWMGSAGIVAALAVFGGVSLASKRFLPGRALGPIQVVGRASLSPKQSVFLVRVGDRVLILGTGPQGGPTALGEVTDPLELARLAPGRPTRTGFDQRIGGEA